MVATSHLDTVWRWTLADTVDMNLLKNIIQKHLKKSKDM